VVRNGPRGRKISSAELDAVSKAVRSKFGLDEEQARALVESARDTAARATDDFEFTSLLNRHFTPGQKEGVIEQLWQVAYADGELSAYEEHFVRRIADLLYVSHGAYIAAKLRENADRLGRDGHGGELTERGGERVSRTAVAPARERRARSYFAPCSP
jgi:uncharacterized tellurite resistance protein B-like protein